MAEIGNLSDISVIKGILSRHGFSFSKGLGQNFLINPTVCPRMAEAAIGDGGGKTGVIEIGAGIGVLTKELCQRADKVVCIEIDSRLIPILAETLPGVDNLKLINEDVLKVDLKKVIEEEFTPDTKVCIAANLPYYITSPIIMKLLESRLPIENIVVMVQKEAAERISAKPGVRECGSISAAITYYSEPEVLFRVSRGSFIPAPNVDSTVIRLNVRKEPAVYAQNEKLFFEVIKAAFSQRRKTILNTLSFGLKMSKDEVRQVLDEAGVNPGLRAEAMVLQNFADISNILCKKFG